MDKQFNGLIHSRLMTLTNFPEYQSNYYTKDEVDKIIQILEQQKKSVDFIDENELNMAVSKLEKQLNEIDFVDENELDATLKDIDVIISGGAPIEKGEEGNGINRS